MESEARQTDSRMADNEDGLAQANQNRESHTSCEASDQAVDKSK